MRKPHKTDLAEFEKAAKPFLAQGMKPRHIGGPMLEVEPAPGYRISGSVQGGFAVEWRGRLIAEGIPAKDALGMVAARVAERAKRDKPAPKATKAKTAGTTGTTKATTKATKAGATTTRAK